MTNSLPDDRQEIDRRFADLLRQPEVELLRDVLQDQDAHLVGGVLRDAALGRRRRDIDLVVAGSGGEVAAELAARFGRRSIRLGGERFAAYRVTTDEPIDIWDRGSSSLEEDLRRRDLTIHSFALDLRGGHLHDPFAGIADLQQGRLRMTTPAAFADDPLRVLRLCRYVSLLPDFRIDASTIRQARASVRDLDVIARERIREELLSTLAPPGSRDGVALWVAWGIFPDVLVGEPLSAEDRGRLLAELAVVGPRFEQAMVLLPAVSDLSGGRLSVLLRLLESVSGEPGSVALTRLRERGSVSRSAARSIARLLSLGPLPVTEPGQRWFLHRAGRDLWPLAVGLAACGSDDPRKGPPLAERLAGLSRLATVDGASIFSPSPALTGEDLRREFGLQPGPRLGKVLSKLERLQVEGRVSSREEALALAARTVAELEGDD
jgi:tRNA nucleotidyltransferase (CCA-adding enzyme)